MSTTVRLPDGKLRRCRLAARALSPVARTTVRKGHDRPFSEQLQGELWDRSPRTRGETTRRYPVLARA